MGVLGLHKDLVAAHCHSLGSIACSERIEKQKEKFNLNILLANSKTKQTLYLQLKLLTWKKGDTKTSSCNMIVSPLFSFARFNVYFQYTRKYECLVANNKVLGKCTNCILIGKYSVISLLHYMLQLFKVPIFRDQLLDYSRYLYFAINMSIFHDQLLNYSRCLYFVINH